MSKKKYRTESALNYIKAITSKGGEGYKEWGVYNESFYEDCFSEWLDIQPKVNGILYRGYQVDKEFYRDYKVGEIIRQSDIYNLDFPSFTTSEMRAVLYINDYEVYTAETKKVLFEVECVGKYAVDISKHSYYPEEKEHKFINDAKFEVVAVINKGTIERIKLKEV